ncbi:MAG TPA: helicase HerA-like domain-containing protein, partial [Chitinophagales bacterium]|nr:helicase HerA-like domain-containing protein [Chitinophagales bacterium]
FCTQLPTDVPPEVLSQLGLKVQHALRAFTANDRKAIKLTSENYPITEYYKTDELLTKLGIGEAIISALNEKGIPTPLTHTLLVAPQSRMDVLSEIEIQTLNNSSMLIRKYNEAIDRESAYEILNDKINRSQQLAKEEAEREERRKQNETQEPTSPKSRRRNQKSTMERVVTSSAFNTVLRGVFNMLVKKR